MPDPLACIRESARELKRRYGTLLQASPRDPEADRALHEAIETARQRLHGQREVANSRQMTLDLRGQQ